MIKAAKMGKGVNGMKRALALLLCILLCFGYTAALAENWYCQYCNRINDDNYCPHCGRAKPANNNNGSINYWTSYTGYSQVVGTLNRKLATRTGPGTEYDEPGSFLGSGYTVIVHSRVYDQMNGIWWLQVEFTVNGKTYWAYTGQQRVDGISLNDVPIEKQIGTCYISYSMTGYYSPYAGAAISRAIPAGVSCKIYGYVNGWHNGMDGADWIQIEFYDYGAGCTRRAWVQDPMVDNYSLFDTY